MNRTAFTLTFGECAENNPGMQKLGKIAEDGFEYKELFDAHTALTNARIKSHLVDLGRPEAKDGGGCMGSRNPGWTPSNVRGGCRRTFQGTCRAEGGF